MTMKGCYKTSCITFKIFQFFPFTFCAALNEILTATYNGWWQGTNLIYDMFTLGLHIFYYWQLCILNINSPISPMTEHLQYSNM